MEVVGQLRLSVNKGGTRLIGRHHQDLADIHMGRSSRAVEDGISHIFWGERG